MRELIAYEEAIAAVRACATARPLSSIRRSIEDAAGFTCTSDAICEVAVPPFRSAAMDGFAVRSAEVSGATPEAPVLLRVLGDIAAGEAPRAGSQRSPGFAWQIATGAAIPVGFDAVIRCEDVRLVGCRVCVSAPVCAGAHVRSAGEDLAPGLSILRAGTVVRSGHVMALAAAGVAEVLVARPVRLALVTTGSELTAVTNNRLPEGGIFDSTSPYLRVLARHMGCEVVAHVRVLDDLETLVAALREVMSTSPDVVVLTGATSVGRHDHAAAALRQVGARVAFHGSAIRPGKPILFAECKLRGPVIFALPGNPAATAVCFRFFVQTYLEAVSGRPPPPTYRATLAREVRKPSGVRCFLSGSLERGPSGLTVDIPSPQNPFMTRSLIHANAWAILPEPGEAFAAGTDVDVRTMSAL